MALCEVQYFSTALQKMAAVNVIVPEGHQGPFPVFYLLHGLSGNHTNWARHSKIEQYVEGFPLIVVMPDGGRSFYTNSLADPQQAYETALGPQLVDLIDNMFQTIPARPGRVIGGLSMGGYGALKFALKYPHLFCGAVSHSGALFFGRYEFNKNEDIVKERRLITGEHPMGGPNDLFALAEQIEDAPLPALRIDCGVDDDLIEVNREFHGFLEGRGISHQYAEYPGGHDWDYWDEHVQEAITFFAGILGIEKQV